MQSKSLLQWTLLMGLLIASVVAVNSQTKRSSKPKPKTATAAPTPTPEPPLRGPNTKEGASQANKGAEVLAEIMKVPDKGIPQDLLDKAECILVFPKVIKGGFILGGQGGRGLASCRLRSGWSAPAYFEIKGGSVGLQIGGEATDFVLLIMNEKGMKSLLSDKFELGGEASIAAGPVGRTTAASTDVKMDAEMLSYSRSKGLFGGLSLKGSVISPEKSDNEGTYGKGIKAETILAANKTRAPAEVQVFPNKLTAYSARTAQ